MMGVKDFFQKCEELKNGWIIASLTDEFVVDNWPFEKYSMDGIVNSEGKILEIRVFDKGSELKLFRSDIGKNFMFRQISSDGDDHYDEIQYLDIDEKKLESDGVVYATGGGKYNLPVVNEKAATRIKVRYYFGKYGETGQAYVKDWRLVELMEGE